VRCVSYGAPDDPDVVAARDIADALDFTFEHVPIAPTLLDDAFFADGVRDAGISTRLTCGAGARVAPVDGDGVVLTGHTGFLSSTMAVLNWGVRTRADVRRMTYARHYAYERLDGLVDAVTAPLAAEPGVATCSLDETLADFDASDPLGEMHRWNQENRQRKLVLNEYRAYGRRAPWMMPLGAHDVVDTFLSLPVPMRLDQQMYKGLVHRLFTGPAEGLARIARVGGRFEHDDRRYRAYLAIERLQPLSGAVLTRALPAARRLRNRRRVSHGVRYGPTPLRHWFRTDGRARAALLERVDGITVDELDQVALRGAVLDPRATERVFQVLLAGALTVQGVADEARRVWRRAQGVAASAPTGTPSTI
jgi:hypothetical protein